MQKNHDDPEREAVKTIGIAAECVHTTHAGRQRLDARKIRLI
jgi:hypothetical protein